MDTRPIGAFKILKYYKINLLFPIERNLQKSQQFFFFFLQIHMP